MTNYIVKKGVYRARSSMDRAPLWLRGRYGFETFARVPSRLHPSSKKNKLIIININTKENKKEKQARSLDRTHIWLRGNLHFNNNNYNNYLKLSFF